MATKYTVRFKNSTPHAYHFAVYQRYPDSPGLDSIAWQVRGLPPNGTSRADWSLNYQVAIADWDENDGQYTGLQLVKAELGKVYSAISVEGDIPDIKPTPTDTTAPGLIKLQNNTNPAKALTMGFAVSNTLIAAEKHVPPGVTTNFKVHPEYYIACYSKIKMGQLVDEGIEVGPVKLVFTNENTDYTVETVVEAGTVKLKGPVRTPPS